MFVRPLERTIPILIVVSAVLLVLAGCPAEVPEAQRGGTTPEPVVLDTRPNAATEYARIHASLGDGFLGPLVNVDLRRPPNHAQASYLHARESTVLELIEATRIERCEFDVDWSQGAHTLDPHLVWLRGLSHLLVYDAHRLVQSPSGRRAAAERLAAAMRMAVHIGDESGLLAKLIAIACLNQVLEPMFKWRAQLAAAEYRGILREAMLAVRASNVFDGCSAMRHEVGVVRASIEQRGLIVLDDESPITILPSERSSVLAEVDRMMAAMERVWGTPGAEHHIREIMESTRLPKAAVVFAGFDTFARHMTHTETGFDAALAALGE